MPFQGESACRQTFILPSVRHGANIHIVSKTVAQQKPSVNPCGRRSQTPCAEFRKIKNMQSAIDFGKDFLTAFFNKKDADATSAFLADDIIWITPNEIRHLKSVRSIHEFLREALQEDPKAYNVDIASIRSAPGLETTTIAVFDVNLIPKHEESSVNIRCTLALHREGVGFSIVYVGMSRKYLRTDVEQIRSFADALPSGVMTLTVMGNDIRVMYVSGWFLRRLGMEEAAVYERMDQNVFFMMPQEDQKRMITLVGEMGALKKPKPLAMQVTLLAGDKKTKIPCHMSVTAVCKDGSRTVLYLTFDEISDVMQEAEREKKKEIRALKAKLAEKDKNAGKPQAADTGEIEERARQQIEEAARIAREESEAAAKLIRTKLEQAGKEKKAAVEKTRREVADQFTAAWKEEKKKNSEAKEALEKELAAAKEAAEAAEAGRKELEEKLRALEAKKSQSDREYQDRILKLEWKVSGTERKAQQSEEDWEKRLKTGIEEARKEEAGKAEKEQESLRLQMEEKLAKEKSEKAELEGTVLRMQKDLSQRELSLKKRDVDQRILSKEKDKSILRMESLLRGQMGSIQSAVRTVRGEKNPEKIREQAEKIEEAASVMPEYMSDLAAISKLNPSGRMPAAEDRFSVKSCLDLVRLVIWPQCRQKGVIFSVEMTEGMPQEVIGGKAGLELAFLCILENAVENTAGGGTITLTASADAPVRGSAYYHFRIEDNGCGISEDRLPVLFDQPESELSIARKVIGTMGGSIQVRSRLGEGASFEIRVNLKLQ